MDSNVHSLLTPVNTTHTPTGKSLVSRQLRAVLAEWLSTAMLSARTDQSKLARLSNVPRQTINRILKEDVSPSDDTIKRLAKALRVPSPEFSDVSPAVSPAAQLERIALLAEACAGDVRDQAVDGKVNVEVAESFFRLIARQARNPEIASPDSNASSS